MSRARDTVMGYGLELGSRVLHSPLIVPDGVYRRIVQRLLHLDQSNDLPLLWRVAQDVSPDERWVEAEPVDPRPTSLADPQHAVVGVPTEALIDAMGRRDAMGRYRRAAVAYGLGSLVMVGTNEARGLGIFLRPVNEAGEPDELGVNSGVGMRIGPDTLVAAIGTVSSDGRDFESLQTKVLDRPASIPDGLYRV